MPAALHDQLIKVHNVRRDLVILMSVELVRKNKHFLTLITHRNAVNPYFSPNHNFNYSAFAGKLQCTNVGTRTVTALSFATHCGMAVPQARDETSQLQDTMHLCCIY